MIHVCIAWYDVWITLCMNFLLHFLKKTFELFPNSLLFRIHGIILLWFFFYFFLNHFFGLIFLLTNIFLIISFETLFEWHAWNCQGLGKAWMRWWRLTGEFPNLNWSRGTKYVWAFPVIDGMKEMMGTSKKKLPLVWEPRMVLGCKSAFDFSQLRRLKNDEVFTSCPHNVIRVFNVNKCPNSKWMMGIYESQTKWLPQFGFGIDKDGLC